MESYFFGVYRATIRNTDDPTGQGRFQVEVPAVSSEVLWAKTCLPSLAEGTPTEPPLDSAVWVAFEAGDPTRPVCLGVLPS
jgi:hypothetical protein